MSGKVCAVFGCNNYEVDRNSRSFFRFPKDKKLCDSWVLSCRRSDLDALYKREGPLKMYKTYKICSDHFIENNFRNPKLFSQGLIPGTIPSQNLPGSSKSTLDPLMRTSLSKRKREDSVDDGSINVNAMSVCSVHFSEDGFEDPLRQHLLNCTPRNCHNLEPDVIPTENLLNCKKYERKPADIKKVMKYEQRNHSKEVNKLLKAASIDFATDCKSNNTTMCKDEDGMVSTIESFWQRTSPEMKLEVEDAYSDAGSVAFCSVFIPEFAISGNEDEMNTKIEIKQEVKSDSDVYIKTENLECMVDSNNDIEIKNEPYWMEGMSTEARCRDRAGCSFGVQEPCVMLKTKEKVEGASMGKFMLKNYEEIPPPPSTSTPTLKRRSAVEEHESDLTRRLSNAELQRLVLLKQWTVLKLKEKKLRREFDL